MKGSEVEALPRTSRIEYISWKHDQAEGKNESIGREENEDNSHCVQNALRIGLCGSKEGLAVAVGPKRGVKLWAAQKFAHVEIYLHLDIERECDVFGCNGGRSSKTLTLGQTRSSPKAVPLTSTGLGAAATRSADKKISYRQQPRQKIFESSPAKLLDPADRATSRQSVPVAKSLNPPSQ